MNNDNRKEGGSMNDKNFDDLWLKELIDKDFERFEMPDSLKSENLIHLLDDIDAETEKSAAPKRKNNVIWLKFASAAACLALVMLGWSGYQNSLANQSEALAAPQIAMAKAAGPAPAAAAETAVDMAEPAAYSGDMEAAVEEQAEAEIAIEYPEQPVAKNYDDIFTKTQSVFAERKKANPMVGGGMMMSSAPAMLASPSAANTAEAVAEDAIDFDVAENGGVYGTNVQVKGVDESDIVKTDGKYIYHYRFDDKQGESVVSILTANGLKPVSEIVLKDNSNAEIYISGNRLIAVGQLDYEKAKELSSKLKSPMSEFLENGSDTELIVPEYAKDMRYYWNFVEAAVYDITDKSAPKQLTVYRQMGDYVSSRLNGQKLYVITNKSVSNGDAVMPAARYIPAAGVGNDIALLKADDILLPQYIKNPNYAVLSSLDILSGKADTKAVLGMADEIMMSNKSLFLTADIRENNGGKYERFTGISRFDITDEGLKYLADCKVEGYIEGQFSLDEHNGMLRVATTSYNEQNETVNNLFVYDHTLQKIGEVTGLAENERIYSVRFMGDMAYVVTFRETDPLFVVDLSDPTKPVVKGELKIPGFSEYLHPIDKNTLVGLGVNTVTTPNNGVYEDGLKLSLFDVSDPAAPKEKTNYLIGNAGSYSEVLSNHKAFMFYPEKKLIAFPATIYTSYGSSYERPWAGERRYSFGGYLVVEVKNNSFNVVGSIPDSGDMSREGFMRNDIGEAISRGIYIGNTLYTISQNKIMAFSVLDFTQIGEYSYN